MKARVLMVAITLVFSMGCNRAPQHSPELDRLLSRYSPTFRLGATVQELKMSGKLRFETPYDSRVSALMLFPKPVDGFVGVRIVFRLQSDSVRPSDTATEYLLFSDTVTAGEAESRATRRVTEVLGPAKEKGCSASVQDVHSWPREKGGAALYLPTRRDGETSFAATTTLVVFASHVSVEDYMGEYETSPCG